MLRTSKQYEFYIVGCDVIPKGFSSGSMLVDKFYHAPEKGEFYTEFLLNICKTEQIDVVISAEEEDLKLFKNLKLKAAQPTYIPDTVIFELFQDKHLANLNVQEKSFLIPTTIMNEKDFLSSKAETFIQRKRISCCSRGIKIFNRNEINPQYNFFCNDYITQEFVFGDMYTVDIFSDKSGKPRLIIPRKSLSEKDGTTFKCIIEKEENIINTCSKFFSEYNIPGISNIQFIVKNGTPYFIELNPRAAATLIASSLASVNFIDLYVSHFWFDQKIPEYDELMNKVKWGSVVSRYYQETIYY